VFDAELLQKFLKSLVYELSIIIYDDGM